MPPTGALAALTANKGQLASVFRERTHAPPCWTIITELSQHRCERRRSERRLNSAGAAPLPTLAHQVPW